MSTGCFILLQHTRNQLGVIGIGSGLYLLQDRFIITCFGGQLFKPSVLSRQHYCARSNQNQVSPFPVFSLPLCIPTIYLQRRWHCGRSLEHFDLCSWQGLHACVVRFFRHEVARFSGGIGHLGVSFGGTVG